MASGLAAYLRSEIDKRGWNDSEFAERAGIQKSTLSKLFKRPDTVPRLDTLDGMARALDVTLATLIRVAGFDPGPDDGAFENQHIAILVDAVPELGSMVDSLAQMSRDDQRAVEAYIQGLRRRGRPL